MTTECNQFVFGFHPQKRREIRAQFDGGTITSDGGGLLLREVEKRLVNHFQTVVSLFRGSSIDDDDTKRVFPPSRSICNGCAFARQ